MHKILRAMSLTVPLMTWFLCRRCFSQALCPQSTRVLMAMAHLVSPNLLRSQWQRQPPRHSHRLPLRRQFLPKLLARLHPLPLLPQQHHLHPGRPMWRAAWVVAWEVA